MSFSALHAGGIEDWIDGHLGIDNTFTIMMFRPSDAYNSKLVTEVGTLAYLTSVALSRYRDSFGFSDKVQRDFL